MEPERRVHFVIQPGIRANGDRVLLRSVLENLINNSWKFTSNHPEARIEFGVSDQDGRRRYFVRDDGAGFDMLYANKLFGIFQRLHGVDEFQGNGIGLAIIERIIHHHGGKVWAEGAVDKGATFYFTIS
jgi:light-regulated signal transduction histidine kinase (bacteriophytochrome)